MRADRKILMQLQFGIIQLKTTGSPAGIDRKDNEGCLRQKHGKSSALRPCANGSRRRAGCASPPSTYTRAASRSALSRAVFRNSPATPSWPGAAGSKRTSTTCARRSCGSRAATPTCTAASSPRRSRRRPTSASCSCTTRATAPCAATASSPWPRWCWKRGSFR